MKNLIDANPDIFEGLSQQEKENIKIVQVQLSGWNTADVDKVLSVMANNGIYHDQAFEEYKGHEQIRYFGDNWVGAVPDFTVEVEQIVASGDLVVSRGFIGGTVKNSFWGYPATQKKFRIPYAQFCEVKNGKIQHVWDFSDTFTMARQVGWDLSLQFDEMAKQ